MFVVDVSSQSKPSIKDLLKQESFYRNLYLNLHQQFSKDGSDQIDYISLDGYQFHDSDLKIIIATYMHLDGQCTLYAAAGLAKVTNYFMKENVEQVRRHQILIDKLVPHTVAHKGRTLYDLYRATVGAIMSIHDPNGTGNRVKDVCFEGRHYPNTRVSAIAAIHLINTGHCGQAAASRLLDCSISNVARLLAKADRVQRFYDQNEYVNAITVESGETAELARHALQAGLIECEEGDIRRALMAARVNPSEWLVVLSSHPVDGVIGVGVESIETSYNYPRLYSVNSPDYAYRNVLTKMEFSLATEFEQKRTDLKMLMYLAALKTIH